MRKRTDAMRRMILIAAMTIATPLLLAQAATDAHVVPLGEGRTVDIRSIKPNTPVTAADEQKEVVTWDSGISYTYDPSGNVRQIGKDTFIYDHVQRLIGATVNGVERNYEYDLHGNRLKCLQDVGTAMEGDCQGYSVDSDDNHIIGATYDPNGSGNVTVLGTHTYKYDAFNMMTRGQAGEAQEFIYTANDERVATYSTGSRTWRWTVRDEDHKVLREFTSSGGTNGTASFQWVKDFVWRDGLLLATVQQEGDLTTTYHYHLDHQGTPRRITDRNDRRVGFHDYFAFGPEKEGKGEPSFTSIRYTGHERDVANDLLGTLDYMHARYYNGALGRFLSLDPVTGDAKSPQTWNRYTYALNNPLNLTDPTGECEWKEGDPPCRFRAEMTVSAQGPTDQEHFLFLQDETKELDLPFMGDWYLAHLYPNALWSSFLTKQAEKAAGHPVVPGTGALYILMGMVGGRVSFLESAPAIMAAEEMVTVYRAVDAVELKAIQAGGTYGSSPSMGGKYFALTEVGAREFAANPFNAGRQMTVTSTSVPRSVYNQGYVFNDPGGAGPSVHFQELDLPTFYKAMTEVKIHP